MFLLEIGPTYKIQTTVLVPQKYLNNCPTASQTQFTPTYHMTIVINTLEYIELVYNTICIIVNHFNLLTLH